MTFSRECCVMSGRCLCVGLVSRSRGVLPSMVYLNEYDCKASKKSSLWPARDFCAHGGWGGWSRQYRTLSNGTTENISFKCVQLGPFCINPLNPELNPICYLLALLGAHHFLHVSRIRVKSLTFSD